MIIVGDIEGEFNRLTSKLVKAKGEQVCQLGDLGIGFYNHDYPNSFGPNFKFIRGNHDNPEVVRKHENYLGEWGISGNVFYISGAKSIDQRIIGVDWWPEEELNYEEAAKALELYKEVRPDYVISHDCPANLTKKIFPYCREPNSVTATLLQMAFEFWLPKAWFFGHYHTSKQFKFEGTTFYCVGIYQQISVPQLYLSK